MLWNVAKQKVFCEKCLCSLFAAQSDIGGHATRYSATGIYCGGEQSLYNWYNWRFCLG